MGSVLVVLLAIVRDANAFVADIVSYWMQNGGGLLFVRRAKLQRRLAQALSYAEWQALATECDQLDGAPAWKMRFESSDYDYILVRDCLDELYKARKHGDAVKSAFMLRSTLSRKLGGMHRAELYSHCRVGTKDLVEQYVDEVVFQLLALEQNGLPGMTPQDKVSFFVSVRQAYGHSALLLSGGAGLGIHHVGVLRALFEVGLLPRIVSGSSVGSLIGALLCTTPEAGLEELFCGSLSVLRSHHFMQREGEVTTLAQRLDRLLRVGVLGDIQVLREACEANFGDMTFQEAYDRSKRILNVTVNSRGPHNVPRLLNYLTSPNVVISSAVCASCALQMLFDEVQILAKMDDGAVRPWNPPGVKWSDGSIASDLPMTRLRELFNVNHFIVSQVNPHIVPLYPVYNRFPRLMHFIAAELEYRLGQLSSLGIFPNVARTIQSVLAQQYTGDITIVPDVGVNEYLSMLSNPTPASYGRARQIGQLATWPQISRVLNQCKIEYALDDIVQRLRGLDRWQLV